MKKNILFTVAMFVSVFANAQRPVAETTTDKNMTSVYFIYSPAKYYGKNTDSDSFNKFAIGGDSASLLPIDNFSAYFTKGLMLEWYHETDNKIKTNMVAIKAPFNVMLDLKLSSQMSVMPFVGANASFGLLARMEEGSVHINMYDKDDVGDYAMRRFLVGWQIGTRVNYNGLYGAVSFEKSFMDIGKNSSYKIGGINIGVGMYL